MKRPLIILGLTVLGLAPQAHAGVFVRGDDLHPFTTYNVWAREARTATPDAIVTVREHDGLPLEVCGARAGACLRPIAIGEYQLDVDRIVDTPRIRRGFFWHELGHVYADANLNAAQRRRYAAIIGRRAFGWAEGEYDDRTSEQFARAYAACATYGPTPKVDPFDWYISDGDLGYVATPDQHRRTCRLIERAALGTGLLDYTPKSGATA